LNKVNYTTLIFDIGENVDYMPPELYKVHIDGSSYNKAKCDVYKVDIFSLGLVFIEIACGKKFKKLKVDQS